MIIRLIQSIAFIIISVLCTVHAVYLFRNTGWSRYNITSFYEEPENSLDVVLVGGSNIFRYFIPLQAYNEQGFTSYDYGAEFGIPFLKTAVQDIMRTQSPKLIVVDPRYFISSCWGNAMETGAKNQLGAQDLNLLSRIEAGVKYKFMGERGYHDAINIFFDLPIYHDNADVLPDRAHWLFSDDNRGDAALSSYGNAKGYVLFQATYEHSFFSDDIISNLVQNVEVPLEPSAEGLYRDFLSYCNKHEVNLLLVEAPFVFTEQDILESNTLAAIAEEYSIPFLRIDFLLDKTGIDYETDYSDQAHVNILGAEKYTTFLAKYISENYDLPDHRGEEDFSSWDAEWKEFQETYRLQ